MGIIRNCLYLDENHNRKKENKMKKILVFALVVFVFQVNFAFASEARYRHILSESKKLCSIFSKEEHAADMLRFNYENLIGHSRDYKFVLNESFMEMAENLYSLSQVLSIEARKVDKPLDCLMMWAGYVKHRAERKTPDEAKKAVIALYKSYYRLVRSTK